MVGSSVVAQRALTVVVVERRAHKHRAALSCFAFPLSRLRQPLLSARLQQTFQRFIYILFAAFLSETGLAAMFCIIQAGVGGMTLSNECALDRYTLQELQKLACKHDT